ncbi:hypothetical protein [Sphingomonas sp. CFBP 13706]|uniref:hypothetical protein n=1 Tax=Sphingomonas sp. CFBP 13706 TaxID=2775314 RepID=UPI00177D00A7|nr:hypothetical protein [Sphingomonas sp. CFBP 13706]MBD8734903.1 hypothetical protein [Sphingomonas sp. CFBP 13706]
MTNVINMSDYQTVDQASIPTMMRRLADRIEKGKVDAQSVFAFTITEDGGIGFYGFGEDRSNLEFAGILALAQSSWWNIVTPPPMEEDE